MEIEEIASYMPVEALDIFEFSREVRWNGREIAQLSSGDRVINIYKQVKGL